LNLNTDTIRRRTLQGRGNGKSKLVPRPIPNPATSPFLPYSVWIALLLALLVFSGPSAAQTDGEPIVQAILFYSPTCPHCHQVINELLIPMQEQYGDRLQIIGLDTSHPVGSQLYNNAIATFAIPSHRQGVPTLIVGETVLVGSGEIPEQFPLIVDEGLVIGGIGWPAIPGLIDAIPDLPPSADPAAVAAQSATATTTGIAVSQ